MPKCQCTTKSAPYIYHSTSEQNLKELLVLKRYGFLNFFQIEENPKLIVFYGTRKTLDN